MWKKVCVFTMWDMLPILRPNLDLWYNVYLTEYETFVFCLLAHKPILCPLVNSTAHQLGYKRYRLQLLLYERHGEPWRHLVGLTFSAKLCKLVHWPTSAQFDWWPSQSLYDRFHCALLSHWRIASVAWPCCICMIAAFDMALLNREETILQRHK